MILMDCGVHFGSPPPRRLIVLPKKIPLDEYFVAAKFVGCILSSADCCSRLVTLLTLFCTRGLCVATPCYRMLLLTTPSLLLVATPTLLLLATSSSIPYATPCFSFLATLWYSILLPNAPPSILLYSLLLTTFYDFFFLRYLMLLLATLLLLLNATQSLLLNPCYSILATPSLVLFHLCAVPQLPHSK